MLESVDKTIKRLMSTGGKAVIIILAIIYVLSPIDFMPGLPFDDIIVVLMAFSFVGIDIKKLFGFGKKSD